MTKNTHKKRKKACIAWSLNNLVVVLPGSDWHLKTFFCFVIFHLCIRARVNPPSADLRAKFSFNIFR